MRTACGTMMPTNPINPATATAAAVASDAATTTGSRTRVGLQPEALCLVVAEPEHIQESAVQQEHSDAHSRIGKDQHDVAPAGRREPAQDPGVDLPQGVGVLLLHEGLHRGEE